MNQIQTLQPSDRRLFLLLIAAALFLGTMLLWRLAGGSATPVVSSPARSLTPLSTADTVAQLRARLQAAPEDADTYAALGLALLQQVRETGDPSLYGQAEQALSTALALDVDQLDALVGQGALALARHDFDAALTWGERARALMPYRADALGILVDAHVELGQYEAAVAAAQAMVDLRPDIASYSRVAYLRELHGDTAGAIAAMTAAVEAGPPGSEATAWAAVQLGHLYFDSGDTALADAAYRDALSTLPEYPYALAGLARLQAANGDTPEAITAYETIVARLPLPEFVIALGRLYEATGRPDQAAAQYDLVRVMQQLNAAAGMNVDLEMALFEADHGDPAAALAMAEAAHAQRPTVVADDVLAWAYYRNGRLDEAQRLSERSQRLGTTSALFSYHAGLIAAAQGDAGRATTYLRRALELNPHFDLLQAEEARAALAALEQ